MTVYACCDQNRRSLVRGSAFNGIDWLEVLDLEAPTPALRQRILHLGFVNDPPPAGLTPVNVVISGGERIVFDGDPRAVEDELSDPAAWATPEATARSSARHEEAQRIVAELYERWEAVAG